MSTPPPELRERSFFGLKFGRVAAFDPSETLNLYCKSGDPGSGRAAGRFRDTQAVNAQAARFDIQWRTNANRSTLITSGCVVHMPCGKPE